MMMRQVIFRILFFFTILVATLGCEKENDSGVMPVVSDGSSDIVGDNAVGGQNGNSQGDNPVALPEDIAGGGENVVSIVKAKNVLFRSSAKTRQESGNAFVADTEDPIVYAENVQLETTGNSLQSTTLQDALDNEMAISITSLLPGTSWKIENKSNLEYVKGTVGQISFGEGTFSMDSGYLWATGLLASDFVTESGTYEILGNNVLFLSCTTVFGPNDSAVLLVARDKDQMIFLGVNRVSVLTRIP